MQQHSAALDAMPMGGNPLDFLQEAAELDKLLSLKQQLQAAEQRAAAASGISRTAEGATDYSLDFFGRPAFLAVSGQLNAEAYACALSDVYTFGERIG